MFTQVFESERSSGCRGRGTAQSTPPAFLSRSPTLPVVGLPPFPAPNLQSSQGLAIQYRRWGFGGSTQEMWVFCYAMRERSRRARARRLQGKLTNSEATPHPSCPVLKDTVSGRSVTGPRSCSNRILSLSYRMSVEAEFPPVSAVRWRKRC